MDTSTIIFIIALVLIGPAGFVLGAMIAGGAKEDELRDAYYVGYGQALEDEGPSNDTLLAVGLAMDPETADALATMFGASLRSKIEEVQSRDQDQL